MMQFTGFKNALVATDFSDDSKAAAQQGLWLMRNAGAKVVLVNSLPDFRKALYSASLTAQLDLLQGEGDAFQHEIRAESQAKLHQLLKELGASDLSIECETFLGQAFVEITHAVQQRGFDLVLAGTRGLSAWEEFFVGNTAKKLIRNCPSSVWIVRSKDWAPPKSILAMTDFSDVSRKAVEQSLWIAQQTNAAFHILHVVESSDLPATLKNEISANENLKQEIENESQKRLKQFVDSLPKSSVNVQTHLATGTPWREIGKAAKTFNADLIAIGTVGRGGIKGLLLGNTAEKVLSTCDCSILTVKPNEFVSPIEPPLVAYQGRELPHKAATKAS